MVPDSHACTWTMALPCSCGPVCPLLGSPRLGAICRGMEAADVTGGGCCPETAVCLLGLDRPANGGSRVHLKQASNYGPPSNKVFQQGY